MTRFAILTLLAAPLALAACTPPPETDVVVIEGPEGPAAEGDTCGAADYQQYVGQQSPEITLPAGTLFRHYRSGDPVTMDMAPARVNFEYDRTGKLVKVSCG
ncbi:MAG: I78 family peptidase inhibitor [Paracoccus sp. (in: a-proteobacteria)]